MQITGVYFLHGMVQYNILGSIRMDTYLYLYREGDIDNYYGVTYLGAEGEPGGKYMMANGVLVSASVGDQLILSTKGTEAGLYVASWVFDCIKLI